jgi:hypothetical protein
LIKIFLRYLVECYIVLGQGNGKKREVRGNGQWGYGNRRRREVRGNRQEKDKM